MAASPARRRPAVVLALVLLGGLLPIGSVTAQVAEESGPILQVSPEIGIATGPLAPLTATVYGDHPETTVRFHVIEGGIVSGAPDQECVVPASSTASSCPNPVYVRSNQAGTSLVRAWIGTSPDMEEGRLSDDRATPGGGVLGGLTGDPAADCQPQDDPAGGSPLGGGQNDACHSAQDPGTGQRDPVQAGDSAEGDGTDVVRITWKTFNEGRLDCQDSHPEDGTDVQYNDASQAHQTEQYTCQLSNLEGAPISGARVDAKVMSGPDAAGDASKPDMNDLCTTGSDGRCAQPFDITISAKGADVVCFWAEPPSDMQGQPGKESDHGDAYGTASNTDGKDCPNLKADSTVRNDVTDVVYLDYDDPRAEGLDVQPETHVGSGPTRFSLTATVYDQFGQRFKGDTALQAKLFPGSVLTGDGGDNDVKKLDQGLSCRTAGTDTCTILTGEQVDLGTNLACVWISAPDTPRDKAPTAMTGDADQESSTCTTRQEAWQEAADQESHVDDTNDDGQPVPPSDGLDVVRFDELSSPTILAVSPSDRRQATSGDVLVVEGQRFMSLAKITLSGTGVKLGPTAVVSDRRLEASLAVDEDAPAGPRDVTVTNNDGGTVTCAGCFRVIGQGYWMVASDGGVFAFGDAPFLGSPPPGSLNKPIVGIEPTPSGQGYWMVASDGGIFAFGDAPFLGSAGSLSLSKPIVSMAATRTGRGYWLVASDGGVFAFGDARFYGTTSRLELKKPIVSIAPTPTGRGYWLMGSDGGIFSFGDARFYGGTGDLALDKEIVAMAPTTTGKGYWVVSSGGGIFAYGDAVYYGSAGDQPHNQPVIAVATTPLGKGYWLVASDGGIFAFGDARFLGSTGDIRLNRPIVGLARR